MQTLAFTTQVKNNATGRKTKGHALGETIAEAVANILHNIREYDNLAFVMTDGRTIVSTKYTVKVLS